MKLSYISFKLCTDLPIRFYVDLRILYNVIMYTNNIVTDSDYCTYSVKYNRCSNNFFFIMIHGTTSTNIGY